MDNYERGMQAVRTLLSFNRKLTLSSITEERVTEQELRKARAAAAVMTEMDIFPFAEGTSKIEFLKEVQKFANFGIEKAS